MRLSLGQTAEHGATPDNHTYYWASRYRYLTVGLDKFQMLAVYVVGVYGHSVWWDVKLQQYLGGDSLGPEHPGTFADAGQPGLLLIDAPQQTGLSGFKTLRLRLNIAGLNPKDSAVYIFVRFLTREQVRDYQWLQPWQPSNIDGLPGHTYVLGPPV